MINNLANFSQYQTLISEKIERNDIIDLYLTISLPYPDDPKYQAYVDEILEHVSKKIKNEIEWILLKELRYMGIKDTLEALYELYVEDSAILKKFIPYINNPALINKLDTKDWAGIYNEWRNGVLRYGEDLSIIEIHEIINKIWNYLFGSDENKKITTLSKLVHIKRSLDWLFININKPRRRHLLEIQEFARLTKTPWSIDSIIKAFNGFRDGDIWWHDSYGGKPWKQIAINARNLIGIIESNTKGQTLISAVDRFVDYVHNTGPVMNKFYGYKEGWLPVILDFKAKALNVRELIPLASPKVRSIMRDYNWRMFFMKHPGMGADDSITGIKEMLKDIFVQFVDDIIYANLWITHKSEQKKWGGEVDIDQPSVKMFTLLQMFGINKILMALDVLQTNTAIEEAINDLIRNQLSITINDKLQRSFFDQLNKKFGVWDYDII